MKLAVWLGAAVGLSTAAAAAGQAEAGVEDPQARVVFARDGSLWSTDPKGKSKPVEVAKLPASADGAAAAGPVLVIRTNEAGDRLLVDVGGRWFWAALERGGGGGGATLTELPCGSGPARLSAKGASVLCEGPGGKARLVRLSDGKVFERDAPAASASLVVRDGVRSMAWIDEKSRVVVAPVTTPQDVRVLAPAAPVRGFLAAPDGSRGVGVYRARPPRPKDAAERDELFGFALDGTAARRRLIRDGVVVEWSWDSRWLLVQDGDKACIARAMGGQFKCWKGFTAVSIAPDGAYALVLGPRGGAGGGDAEKEKERGEGEGGGEGEGEGGGEGEAEGEGEGEGEGEAHGERALPKGPLSLYRAKLNGPYTERPALVETVVDGAAVWLPLPGTAATAAAAGATAATRSTPTSTSTGQ